MTEFNLDAFLEGIERDRSHSSDFDPSKILNSVMMSSQTNQGIITFIPFLSPEYGNFYLKIGGVLEHYGSTNLTNSGEGWYRLLPIEFYGQLTETELQLYNEVRALYNQLGEYEPNFGEYRIRTYSLFTGIQISHVSNADMKKKDELNNCACLYIFPSNRVIDAFNASIQAKIDLMHGKQWIPALLSPSNTGRKGVIQISFTKSTGAGYDASVQFEFNSDFNMIVDPTKVFPDEVVNLFGDVMKTFLGWRYDKTNNKLFNVEYMQQFRDSLKLTINNYNKQSESLPKPAEEGVTYENKNVADPNKTAVTDSQANPAPAADLAPAVKPPF